MPDLILRHQDQAVEFLKQHGPTVTRIIAAHFDWDRERTRQILQRLERRMLVQSRKTMMADREEGLAVEWMVID
jgi:hypothetical protein